MSHHQPNCTPRATCCLPPCPLSICPHPQPGEQAKYGSVFEGMLRSSSALQAALQRVATVAQLRCGLQRAVLGLDTSDRCVLALHDVQ